MKALVNLDGKAISVSGQALASELFYDSAADSYLHDVDYSDDAEYTYSDIDDYKDTNPVLSVNPVNTIHMLNIGNIKNVRDIGGWSCDGGKVRYGKIFRGAKVDDWTIDRTTDPYTATVTDFLTDDDKYALHNRLGVRADIDMRLSDLAGGQTVIADIVPPRNSSPIGEDVEYYPMFVTMYKHAVNLESTKHYYQYTAAVIRKIFECVQSGKPIYLHCTQGADRTGTICFILKALLGVSRSDNDKDYELTSFAVGDVNHDEFYRPRFKEGASASSASRQYQDMVFYFNGLNGTTLRDKVVTWAIDSKVGISLQEINAFRQAMIDGDPDILQLQGGGANE